MQTARACAVITVGFAAFPAFALDIEKSVEVAASPEEAWQALADFCSIAVWHPGIAACEQSEQDGATLRTLTTGDGGVVLEKLIEHDDQAMSFTYTILESPLPVADYVSTMKVSPASGAPQSSRAVSSRPRGQAMTRPSLSCRASTRPVSTR